MGFLPILGQTHLLQNLELFIELQLFLNRKLIAIVATSSIVLLITIMLLITIILSRVLLGWLSPFKFFVLVGLIGFLRVVIFLVVGLGYSLGLLVLL
jgi:polyferredoxin